MATAGDRCSWSPSNQLTISMCTNLTLQLFSSKGAGAHFLLCHDVSHYAIDEWVWS